MKKLLCMCIFYKHRHRGSQEGNGKEFAIHTDAKINLIYASWYINLASWPPSPNLKEKSGKERIRNFVTVLIYIVIVILKKKDMEEMLKWTIFYTHS